MLKEQIKLDQNGNWTCNYCGHLNTENEVAINELKKGNLFISSCKTKYKICKSSYQIVL